MSCDRFAFAGGGVGILCSRGKKKRGCSECGARVAIALCDHPLTAKKTCSRALCERCRTHRAPDRDYCPEHARELEPPPPAPARRGRRELGAQLELGLFGGRP